MTVASPLLTNATETQKGGRLPYKGLKGDYPHFPAYTLADRAMSSLKATFHTRGHYPSADMLSALEAVLRTLEAMADGVCEPLVYLSSLDPGVGKTTAVIHFLWALLASTHHQTVAVLVCVQRLDQIKTIVREANLPSSAFAVLTADKELNALGCGTLSKARILFTTHQMIERRCDGRLFSDVAAFHYLGRPREVRIWDEAILPGRPLTMRRDDISFLYRSLRGPLPALTADLEQFNDHQLGSAKDGETVVVPDFADKHGLTLNDVLDVIGKGQQAQVAAIECLWFLSGKMVTVRKDGNQGNTMLDYRDTLPDDFKPVLALDASGRIRTTYRFWEERRGGIKMLPKATKRYDNLTIPVWTRGGGKDAFREGFDRLVQGVAGTIAMKPQEPWLIVHHKSQAGRNFEEAVRTRLPDRGPNAHFLHWGIHDATNDFAHIPNVILAGTLFYPMSHYEALGRLAAGHPSEDGTFDEQDHREIMVGEHGNLILQAACRGAVRRCLGGGCPPASVYLIASAKSGIARSLPDIFPGAKIVPWKPVKTPLKGKVGEACNFLLSELERDPYRVIPFKDVMRHIGWMSTTDFRRDIRYHEDFIDALCEHGIEEWGKGVRTTGFRLIPFTSDEDL